MKYFGVGVKSGQVYLVKRIRPDIERPDRAQMIYEYIKAHLAIKGRPPTTREISEGTSIPPRSVHGWLWKLHDEGKIKRLPLVARGIILCQNS